MIREKINEETFGQKNSQDIKSVANFIYSKLESAQSGKNIDELLDYLHDNFKRNGDADMERRMAAVVKAYNDFIFGFSAVYSRINKG